jgi:hypothetical protein
MTGSMTVSGGSAVRSTLRKEEAVRWAQPMMKDGAAVLTELGRRRGGLLRENGGAASCSVAVLLGEAPARWKNVRVAAATMLVGVGEDSGRWLRLKELGGGSVSSSSR